MIFQNTKVQVASLVLIFTLSFVYFANQQYFAGSKNAELAQNARFPASLGESTMGSVSPQTATNISRSELSAIEENELAEELAKPSARRSLASVGEPANSLQSLQFEKLESKYVFKMDGDRVSRISISDDKVNEPTLISDRADFLKTFSSQFGVTDKLKKVSAVSKGDTLIETYRAKSASSDSDRLIRVTVGHEGGLLEINSEDVTQTHIF